MSTARIRKVIIGVHMGLGHDGLGKLLAKSEERGGAGIDVETLNPGDLVMCMNAAGDKLKVIGHRGLVLGYLKMPNRQRIMPEALQFIPQTFGASGFDYNKACLTALEQKMGKRHVGPLDAARAKKQAGI